MHLLSESRFAIVMPLLILPAFFILYRVSNRTDRLMRNTLVLPYFGLTVVMRMLRLRDARNRKGRDIIGSKCYEWTINLSNKVSLL